MSTPPAPSSWRTLHVLRALLCLSLIVPALIVVLVAWQDRGAVLHEAEQRVEKTVGIMQEHAVKIFDTHALVLEMVAQRIAGLDWNAIAHSADIATFLREVDAPRNQIASIWLADEEGIAHASSAALPPAGSTEFDRDYFQAQRDGNTGLFIGSPHISRVTKEPSFGVSRRRLNRDGSFGGVIHVAVSISYFEHFFRSLEPTGGHRAVLMRADGVVLASDAPPPGEVAQFPPDSALMRSIASGRQNETWTGSAGDPHRHFFRWKRLGEYPLYVAYAVDQQVALLPWYEHLRFYVAIGAGAALALFGVALLALRRAQGESVLVQRLAEEASRREAAEAALRHSQKMEAVGQLTGGVAHDFNNLLTSVIGNLDRITGDPSTTVRVRRLAAMALQSAEHGARLTAQLLAFGRRQDLRPQVLNPDRLLELIRPLLKGAIGDSVDLGYRFAPGLWAIDVDASHLQAAILNLAINARDAMPSGGRLQVDARNQSLDAEAARPLGVAPGDYVEITVADTGTGMPRDVIERAFEPFFTTKEVGKGTGLGLSMVYGFARQSAGAIALESSVGTGTTVRLYLPRAVRVAPAVDAAPEAQAALPRGDGNVLVVEDDIAVRQLTVDTLTELGYGVLVAPDGPTAVAALRRDRVDLLFSDVVMPGGMTGIDLARHARAAVPGIRVILTSGYSHEYHRTADLAREFEFITKPYRPSDLASKVRDVMNLPPATGKDVESDDAVQAARRA